MSEILRQNIKSLLEKQELPAKHLSLELGYGETYIRDFLVKRTESISHSRLAPIAKRLGTTVPALLGEAPVDAPATRDLPVMGRAAASIVGSENVITEAIEFTATPPGLVGVRDAYVLWVEGDSMKPLYKPRDPIFVHPRQPIARGDIVVVQQEIDGSVYASVKEFIRNDDKDIVTLQYNKEAEIRFSKRQVVAVHRVLPVRELFNM